ncbi:metalloregulator ArsR/SmtB family transcription factor [Paucisalibacillus sp. EB02]|uniref:metalloregulator ArsR/SmtB family transcription factor n=1 Tax=Paucisalibacillus sp. EB02 TaxID=1347087 RepID=UPI0005A6D870|nr:metalloregulator ArsR/SmtB family transcription factor [Paucisalibacillus sp. EB02]
MSDVYRALGDPTRRQILNMLKSANLTQKEIVEAFDISQPAIKKHLNVLLEEEIVTATIQGKYRIYSLNQESLQIAYKEMLQSIGDLLDDQLESLKNYVEKGEE